MEIIIAKHDNNSKEYIFSANTYLGQINPGDRLTVNTSEGIGTVTAITGRIRIECFMSGWGDKLLCKAGAYLPLKEVVGHYITPELTEDERRRIAIDWFNKKISSVDTLPFLGG